LHILAALFTVTAPPILHPKRRHFYDVFEPVVRNDAEPIQPFSK
jgi:hypothetical protein